MESKFCIQLSGRIFYTDIRGGGLFVERADGSDHQLRGTLDVTFQNNQEFMEYVKDAIEDGILIGVPR